MALLALACVSETPTPLPTAPDVATLPLQAGISGIPKPGAPTATVDSRTPPDTVQVAVEQSFQLGHCGLASPIDFDGSLWDPTFGDDGSGGPLTDPQIGELINQTATVLVLVDTQTAQLVTPLGARIVLLRHNGARAYGLCD